MDRPGPERRLIEAERYTPELLHRFLADLETTGHSRDVWALIVGLGKQLNLPYIDFISASSLADFRKTLFIRTSYDSTWLNELNRDPDLHRWSYFRSHAMHHLTPIMVGIEFIDEYHHIPAKRAEILRRAAKHGIRAGFSIPLRVHAPPQAALLTFSGNHSRRDMIAIVKAHGWTLNVAALAAHQRYVMHFAAEFPERNHVSPKQTELLELIGQGLQDKQIADQLGISISAVRQRLHTLMEKTGLSTRTELATLAMGLGILPDPLHGPGNDADEVLIEMDEGGIHRR